MDMVWHFARISDSDFLEIPFRLRMEKALLLYFDVTLITTARILVFLNEHSDKSAIDSICLSFRTCLQICYGCDDYNIPQSTVLTNQ